MLKKMMLLAISVGALVAFAVPATASATDVWTNNDSTLVGSANQSFEGVLQFTTPSPPLPVHTTFGCRVTVEIEAVAPSGGKILKFARTTSECEGTGVFTGCVLKEDFTNIEIEEEEVFIKNWNIDVSTTPATVKANTGNLTIHNVYVGCLSGLTTSHLEFPSISVTPTLNAQGTITKLDIHALATNGVTTTFGTLTPENLAGEAKLGIETTP
jgi:hypothetical protein